METRRFGELLRSWRRARRLSQEQLAARAEVSPRHLSCVETGKSAPSRTMVLVLANALDLPLRDRNTLLHMAGFAPAYRETAADAPDTAMRRVLDLILAHHSPYPALAVTRLWNLVAMNPGGVRVFGAFLPEKVPDCVTRNLAHALFHPDGVRRYVVNWEEVASSFLERAHQEALLTPDDPAPRQLLDTIADYCDVPRSPGPLRIGAHPEVYLPVHLKRDSLDLRFFTTITTLGTPIDVAAQEIRIESYFPADPATDAWLREGGD